DPKSRTLHVFSSDDPPRLYRKNESISDPAILPGFSSRSSEFFEEWHPRQISRLASGCILVPSVTQRNDIDHRLPRPLDQPLGDQLVVIRIRVAQIRSRRPSPSIGKINDEVRVSSTGNIVHDLFDAVDRFDVAVAVAPRAKVERSANDDPIIIKRCI